MAIKARIFNVAQDERHPDSGELLLNEAMIKDALAHRTIKRWAYICHDRDVYTKQDEADNPKHVAGTVKPKHWHVVIEMGSNQIEVTKIAQWLGIEPQYVDVAKGKGAFLDCVQYLTHEDDKQQSLGKRLYDDSEVVSNFDFRAEIDKRIANKLKYGRDLVLRDQMRYDVLYNGKTLKQCMEEDRIAYMEDIEKLKKLRMEYISNMAPPSTRMNYYICGKGGVGKGLISRALARSLYQHLPDDADIFFEVGAKGAAFEGYDGQPVIIWNDRRAYDLLQELNGRGNVFNVFDTHPTRQKQNIKYGSVNLCHEVNIVNSVQDYEEFLDGLAGEYKRRDGELEHSEDKGQSYRRFPFILPLRKDDFDMLINKGFMYDTDEFEAYERYNNIRGNMQKIAIVCGTNEQLARELEQKTIAPVTEKHFELVGQIEARSDDPDSIRAMFADYGTMQPNIKEEQLVIDAEIIDSSFDDD